MKRDFSNSTRAQLKEIISNNRPNFYTGDVSCDNLFACYEASGEDYSQFYDEIEGVVKCANTDYLATDSKVDRLIEEIDAVFNAAQEKDIEYSSIVEGNITLTTDNLISDFKTLVDALDVNAGSDVSVVNLESLEAGEMGSVFGNPHEFETSLSDVDNPLYEKFYAQLINAYGQYDYEAITNFVTENQDEMSLWELQVFATILNSYVDPVTGLIDGEGVEQFMEAFYIAQPDAPVQDYIIYNLADEYTEIYAYYDAYVASLLQSYDGDVVVDDNAFYAGVSNLNGLLAGLNEFGQEIVVNDVEVPSITGGSPYFAPNELNIHITSEGNWMEISVDNVANIDTINVSHFGPITESLVEGQIHSLEEQYQNPDDAYAQALSDGWNDYLVSQVISPVEELLPDQLETALDVAEIFNNAEEEREEQAEQNAENQAQIDWLTYLQLCGNASGDNVPCNGTVITCGTESIVINQQINVNGLTQAVESYNDTVPDNQHVTTEEIISAVQDPSTMDYEHLNPYFNNGNNSALQGDETNTNQNNALEAVK